jgi:hypothetical protein
MRIDGVQAAGSDDREDRGCALGVGVTAVERIRSGRRVPDGIREVA